MLAIKINNKSFIKICIMQTRFNFKNISPLNYSTTVYRLKPVNLHNNTHEPLNYFIGVYIDSTTYILDRRRYLNCLLNLILTT